MNYFSLLTSHRKIQNYAIHSHYHRISNSAPYFNPCTTHLPILCTVFQPLYHPSSYPLHRISTSVPPTFLSSAPYFSLCTTHLPILCTVFPNSQNNDVTQSRIYHTLSLHNISVKTQKTESSLPSPPWLRCPPC